MDTIGQRLTSGRERRAHLLTLLVIAVVHWTTMPGQLYTGDPVASRHGALSLVQSGRLAVPADVAEGMGVPGQFFARNPKTGLYYAKYGIGNELAFAVPLLVRAAIPRVRTAPAVLSYNLLSIGLTLAFAFALLRTLEHMGVGLGARIAYVLSSLYGTCVWNYTRAQSSEHLQLLGFTLLVLGVVVFLKDATAERGAVLAGIGTAVLIAVKLVFVPLAAVVPLFAAWAVRRGSLRFWLRLLVPIATACLLVAFVNWHKFGSPLRSGYEEYEPHPFQGKLSEALLGFAFHPQRSVFVHFPLLLLVPAGLPLFVRHHKRLAIFLAAVLALYLAVYGSYQSWQGEWAYGPRYLIFLLPSLGLPVACLLDRLPQKAWPRTAAVALLAALFALAARREFQVNSLPFFAFYSFKHPTQAIADTAEVRDYFARQHFGRVNSDVLAFRHGERGSAAFERMRRSVPEASWPQVESALWELGPPNFYHASMRALVDAR